MSSATSFMSDSFIPMRVISWDPSLSPDGLTELVSLGSMFLLQMMLASSRALAQSLPPPNWATSTAMAWDLVNPRSGHRTGTPSS